MTPMSCRGPGEVGAPDQGHSAGPGTASGRLSRGGQAPVRMVSRSGMLPGTRTAARAARSGFVRFVGPGHNPEPPSPAPAPAASAPPRGNHPHPRDYLTRHMARITVLTISVFISAHVLVGSLVATQPKTTRFTAAGSAFRMFPKAIVISRRQRYCPALESTNSSSSRARTASSRCADGCLAIGGLLFWLRGRCVPVHRRAMSRQLNYT